MYNLFSKLKTAKPRRGTSLLELTVVLAVMGTLATTVAVTFSGVRENSADSVSMTDLMNFGKQVALNGQSFDFDNSSNAPGSRLVSGPVLNAEQIIPDGFTGCKQSGYTYDAVILSKRDFQIEGAGTGLNLIEGPAERTQATDSAAGTNTWSYCIAEINGVEILGLASISTTDNCVFAKGDIDKGFDAWSYGADLGGNCTGAVALYLTEGATSGGDSPLEYIDRSLAGAPTAATLLSATGGNEKMTLNWTPSASSDTVRYKIYQCDNECDEADLVSSANLLPWPATSGLLDTEGIEIPNLSAGTNFRYAVVPVDGTGYVGAPIATSLVPTRPQAPSCPSVTTLDGAVSLNFSQFPVGHVVTSVSATLQPQSGGSVVTFTSDSIASGKVTATGLVNGEVYTVFANANNSSGASVNSCQRTVVAMALPAQPQWETPAAVVGDTSITLNWTAVTATTASPVAGYTLLMLNPSSGIYEMYGLLSSSATSVEVPSLTSGVAQSFQLSAYNDNANGLLSEVVTATPIAAPLAPTSVSTGRVNLGGYVNWSSVSSAGRPVEGFYAYLDGTRVGTIVYDAETSTYSQTFNLADTGVTIVAGTTYSSSIKAFNTRNGVKIESAPLTFSFTAVAAPAQVTGVAVNPVSTSDTSLRVSWTPLVSSTSNPVSQYAVMRLSNSSGVYELDGFVATSASEYTSTGLVSGVSYTQ